MLTEVPKFGQVVEWVGNSCSKRRLSRDIGLVISVSDKHFNVLWGEDRGVNGPYDHRDFPTMSLFVP